MVLLQGGGQCITPTLTHDSKQRTQNASKRNNIMTLDKLITVLMAESLAGAGDKEIDINVTYNTHDDELRVRVTERHIKID